MSTEAAPPLEFSRELILMGAETFKRRIGIVTFGFLTREADFSRAILMELREQLIEEAKTAEKEELYDGVYHDTPKDIALQIGLVDFLLTQLPDESAA